MVGKKGGENSGGDGKRQRRRIYSGRHQKPTVAALVESVHETYLNFPSPLPRESFIELTCCSTSKNPNKRF